MAAMSIQEFVSDKGRMKADSDWLNDPVTQEMLAMAREYKAPSPLKSVSGENALYQYGMVEGANLVLTLLTRMEDLVKQQQMTEMLSEPPDYGAADILKEKNGNG
jgi:hypothetical protein